MKPNNLVLLLTGILLMHAVIFNSCKHEAGELTPPTQPPTLPSPGKYLVSAIYVNGIPKDTLIYNDARQVIRRWEFVPFYRKFIDYIDYTYNTNGYVKLADYYTYIGGSMLHTKRDSVSISTGEMTTYTTLFRGDGTVSGYDTVQYTTDTYNQLNLAVKGAQGIIYSKYTYNDRAMTGYRYKITVPGSIPIDRNYAFEYSTNTNPLYPITLANPLLMRTLVKDIYPYPMDTVLPWLASQHYVNKITYTAETKPPVTSAVTYTYTDTTRFAASQYLPALGITINYRYKVIR
ncbi:hypothetical protein SAMN05444266_104310 [Chitinophaga jiangningensis]|uniref:Uncharacterized protein n=1 Tax=Chitinophaga jiangningensis TaxID=1419482 RepID=A0A1M7CFS7_9BACT|nr:hypothetical protein [Chitinophaga jiangningensis]SHL66073.1 hypothetical protein SAMN05444266_104310 [Chitinophaga jiangningensis]